MTEMKEQELFSMTEKKVETRGRKPKNRVLHAVYLDKNVSDRAKQFVKKGNLSDYINSCLNVFLPK